MKNQPLKTIALITALALVTFAFTGCTGNSQQTPAGAQGSASSSAASSSSASSATPAKVVASDGADMQTSDPSMPTRKLPENGTRINMHFEDTVIPGVLNDSETAQALVAQLPVTVHMNRYSHDFCGSGATLDLPYSEDQVQQGMDRSERHGASRRDYRG